MGCKTSKNPDPSDVPLSQAQTKPADAAKPGDAAKPKDEKPRPLIFALMRNGHEVIRGAVKELQAKLDANDLDGFRSFWKQFAGWQHIHKNMEDGVDGVCPGFFKVLNENFDGIATKEGLTSAHDDVDSAEKAVDDSITSNADLATTKTVFAKFLEVNDPHLKHEEDVMMPKVMQLKKNGVNLKEVMAEKILPAAIKSGDMKSFVVFAMQMLEKHSDGMPRARVFAHALWGVATDKQWAEWEPWVKEGLSAKIYGEMAPLFVRETINGRNIKKKSLV